MSRALPTPSRVLVIQLRRVGDAVITTALLEDLRRAFPAARLDFLTRPGIAPLLIGHPFADETVVYDRERPLRMWSAIRARRYDWVIDSESSPRSAMLSVASRAPVRVGWRVRVWQWAYTHRVSRRAERPPAYVVLDRQRLLEAVGVPVVPTRPRLALSDEERALGEAELTALGAPAGAPRVGLLLSAGSRAKEWPPARFAELAEGLIAAGVTPVVFEMPGDEGKVDELLSRAPSVVRAPAGDLRYFLRMLSACRVLVAGDTGPVHVATAIDVPTVAVFGPSNPEGWSPRIEITAVVRADTETCPQCRSGAKGVPHRCMAGVNAGTVLARAREYLDRAPRAATAP